MSISSRNRLESSLFTISTSSAQCVRRFRKVLSNATVVAAEISFVNDIDNDRRGRWGADTFDNILKVQGRDAPGAIDHIIVNGLSNDIVISVE
ncbi:Uncharacterised protein [Klebsiella oxytoca]|nr:Uncharacterised protein [Klebsiella oxytoca]